MHVVVIKMSLLIFFTKIQLSPIFCKMTAKTDIPRNNLKI